MKLPHMIVALVLMVAGTACALLPHNEAAKQELEQQRTQIESLKESNEAALAAVNERMALAEKDRERQAADLEAARVAGDTEAQELIGRAIDSIDAEMEANAASRETLEGQLAAFLSSLDSLKQQEREIIAKDAGEKTGTVLDLAGILLAGFGAGGAGQQISQRFGKSRSAAAVDNLQGQINKVQSEAQTAIDNAQEMARREVANAHRLLEVYKEGLLTPTPPIPTDREAA
jgi:hypothetical protein